MVQRTLKVAAIDAGSNAGLGQVVPKSDAFIKPGGAAIAGRADDHHMNVVVTGDA